MKERQPDGCEVHDGDPTWLIPRSAHFVDRGNVCPIAVQERAMAPEEVEWIERRGGRQP